MNILEKIITDKRKEILKKKKNFPISFKEVKAREFKNQFSKALKKEGTSIIAEIKRKSPSAGTIREDFDHLMIAETYEKSGAAAISVLTDSKYFGGELSFISDIKNKIKIPVLRKEFVIDEYQIYESAIAGADAILLIVRALTSKKLKKFVFIASELGLEPLVEAHSYEELQIAIDSGCSIIGINNRNLDTMEVDLETSLKLIEKIPENFIKVSESGIHSYKEIKLLKNAGFDAFLIGESLMREKNPGKKLKALLEGK